MSEKRWLREIQAMGACAEAVRWADAYATEQEMWDACDREDWMLWLLSRRGWPAGALERYRAGIGPIDERFGAALNPINARYTHDQRTRGVDGDDPDVVALNARYRSDVVALIRNVVPVFPAGGGA